MSPVLRELRFLGVQRLAIDQFRISFGEMIANLSAKRTHLYVALRLGLDFTLGVHVGWTLRLKFISL